jgi:uncharacterized protein with HEPN domain
MPSKRPGQRLCDIVENADLIVEFTAAMSFDQYLADARTRLAVERCLSIIAEAARKLGTEAETRCPEFDGPTSGGAVTGSGTSIRASDIG